MITAKQRIISEHGCFEESGPVRGVPREVLLAWQSAGLIHSDKPLLPMPKTSKVAVVDSESDVSPVPDAPELEPYSNESEEGGDPEIERMLNDLEEDENLPPADETDDLTDLQVSTGHGTIGGDHPSGKPHLPPPPKKGGRR